MKKIYLTLALVARTPINNSRRSVPALPKLGGTAPPPYHANEKSSNKNSCLRGTARAPYLLRMVTFNLVRWGAVPS